MKPTAVEIPVARPSNSSSMDIEALTKQLEGLSLNQAQLMSLLANMTGSNGAPEHIQPQFNHQAAYPENQQSQGPPGQRAQWCPQTKALINEQRISYDAARDRGFTGGVADWIRLHDQQDSTSTSQANPPVASASTNTMGISLGPRDALKGNVFAISSLNPDDFHSAHPSLRSGKDTGVRFDPLRRPEDKGKGREHIPGVANVPTVPRMNPTLPKNIPAPKPATSTKTNIPPPVNPINREDGWKASRPANMNQKDDVQMKDATKKDKSSTGPQYHYTSDIQDMADPKAVLKHIMNLDVTLPLYQVVGNSPALQKLVGEAARTKREYTNKLAEYFYDGYFDQETVDYEQVQTLETNYESTGGDTGSDRHLYCHDCEHLPEFLRRYGSALDSIPESRYYAMTTGTFHLTINGIDFTAMIDTGSELNLASNSVPARCGIPIDFEGMKWSLKGVHEVPMKIGGHDFAHHLFISHQELGKHDMILGQPFLQWFAARMDYDRSGKVKLVLWKDGNRQNRPTLAVTITDPQNPRNATKISHQVEVTNVTDDEDEDFRR
ncbi:hypothetical protein IW262DRAFT_1464478 [Armillaria fumosa]|nr:hypothetical protein IW262DRAFT_1464478 [Armillaria fumosa]